MRIPETPPPFPTLMQQLSKAGSGGLQILGFAGNSAPDHMDHLFALEDWLSRLMPQAVARKKP